MLLHNGFQFGRCGRNTQPFPGWMMLFEHAYFLWQALSMRQYKTKKEQSFDYSFLFRRGGRIRTCDPLVPNQVR